MLPFPDILCDGLHPATKSILAQTQHPTCLQYAICGSFVRTGVVAEKTNQPRPERGCGFDFVPLPTFVMLPQCVQTSGDFLLGQLQDQTAGQEMLP